MRKSWFLWTLIYLVDAALFIIGFYLAFILKFGVRIPDFNLQPFVRLIPYICLLVLVFFLSYDLYSASWKRRSEIVYSVVLTAIFTNVATMALSFWLRGFAFPRSVFFIAVPVQIVLLSLWRLAGQRLLERSESARRVVVIAGNGRGRLPAEQLASLLGRSYRVIGAYHFDDREAALRAMEGAQAVCIDNSLPAPFKEQIISRCLEEDKQLYLVPDLYDILLHNAVLYRADDIPLFQLQSLSLSQGQLLQKRLFDLLFSAVLLVAASPLLLVLALAVRLTSPGPVFYTQERVGYNGAGFRLIKFRTMVDRAERDSGPVLAAEDDPRITPVGRLLRGRRLDELPQLLNVLKGEMSFVGPRPERPLFVERFSRELPEYRYRLKLKPGLTGLAQVKGRYGTDTAGKLRYDLYYLGNYSLLLDLQVILQTLRVMLIPETARGVERPGVNTPGKGRGV
jgi:exopolysaccharide biosynthesis polyprenyl glycosylphosphotransferase